MVYRYTWCIKMKVTTKLENIKKPTLKGIIAEENLAIDCEGKEADDLRREIGVVSHKMDFEIPLSGVKLNPKRCIVSVGKDVGLSELDMHKKTAQQIRTAIEKKIKKDSETESQVSTAKSKKPLLPESEHELLENMKNLIAEEVQKIKEDLIPEILMRIDDVRKLQERIEQEEKPKQEQKSRIPAPKPVLSAISKNPPKSQLTEEDMRKQLYVLAGVENDKVKGLANSLIRQLSEKSSLSSSDQQSELQMNVEAEKVAEQQIPISQETPIQERIRQKKEELARLQREMSQGQLPDSTIPVPAEQQIPISQETPIQERIRQKREKLARLQREML